MSSAKRYELNYFTATILEWKYLLLNDAYKDIIAKSLKFLVDEKRIQLYSFVIMNNHLHLICDIIHPYKFEQVQRSFLRFSAQMIIKDLRDHHPELLQEFFVGAKDRKHQIWERKPLNIEIWSESVLRQKLDYIHQNPVRAGLCAHAEEYKYSSAAFYINGSNSFDMLTSCFM